MAKEIYIVSVYKNYARRKAFLRHALKELRHKDIKVKVWDEAQHDYVPYNFEQHLLDASR